MFFFYNVLCVHHAVIIQGWLECSNDFLAGGSSACQVTVGGKTHVYTILLCIVQGASGIVQSLRQKVKVLERKLAMA